MRHEPILPPQTGVFDLSDFARQVVIDGILAASDDKGIMKERIMLARQCGFLDDDETRLWIVQHGLEAA